MKHATRLLGGIFILAALLLVTGPCQAQWLNNNEVAFTGVVNSIEVNGANAGTLVVRIDTAELRVLVNSKTLLKDAAGEEITMERFAALKLSSNDLLVEVLGKFSSGGILGTMIRVVDTLDSDTFRLRGTINEAAMSGVDLLLSLLGMRVVVTPDTAVQIDGSAGSAADLKVGVLVEAEGDIQADGPWIADTVRILTENKRRGSLVFEGEIVEMDSATGRMGIAVTGMSPTGGNVAVVYLTPATRIVGDLAIGTHVQVSGVFNADLSVKAKQILVLSALEIKPDGAVIKVGETALFTLKLRDPAATDITVHLTVDDAAVVSLSSADVTIAKDGQTVDFKVTGLAAGRATVTATAGTESATATVKVTGGVDDTTDPPADEASISFAPDYIKVKAGESREVVLLVKPPQKDAVEISFEVAGDTQDLFAVGDQRALGNGAASMKVTIQAGTEPGTGTLTAALPAALGGGKAVLAVEVVKANGKK